ncbi:hypothetical protein D3C77_362420 [compost metagenome]
MGVGPRHHDLAGLERLAQAIQRLRRIFGQFVEEQHAVVRQGSLARPGLEPAAGQGGHGGRVVGGAKRPVARQGAPLDQAGHRPDHGGLQPLHRRQRRQQSRQAGGHHRLARTRRADEQQIVAAGGGDLQRPLGALLALDLAQVGHGAPLEHRARLRRTQHLNAAKMVDQADQRARRQQANLARPGRLRPIGLGTDQAQAQGVHRHGRRQGSAHGGDLAVQSQFAHRRPAVQRIRPDHPHGGQQGQGDGQVEMAAFLGQVGGGQVGDDLLGRQGQADAGEGAAHPLAALGHRLVRQADDGEGPGGGRHLLHLDVDPARLDPVEGHRHHPRDHELPPADAREQITNPNRLQERR